MYLIMASLLVIVVLFAILAVWTMVRRATAIRRLRAGRPEETAQRTFHRRTAWEEAGRRMEVEPAPEEPADPDDPDARI